MSKERASNILERMPPDEAADVLGDLPEAKAQELINLMDKEEAEDVQELLEHEEHTAGGLMTTEYLAFPPDMTVEESIKELRLEVRMLRPSITSIFSIAMRGLSASYRLKILFWQCHKRFSATS